jgi:phenylacetate-CoA ligase
VANLSACGEGRLHVDEDFALVEFQKTEAAGYYEIIGTNLTNLAQAFVRYRTGDLATDLADGCPCGWAGRSVARVDGRLDDVVVTADGNLVGRLGPLFYDTPSVAVAQIVQRDPGEIDVHLVPLGAHVTAEDLDAIMTAAALRLGERTVVEFTRSIRCPSRPGRSTGS